MALNGDDGRTRPTPASGNEGAGAMDDEAVDRLTRMLTEGHGEAHLRDVARHLETRGGYEELTEAAAVLEDLKEEEPASPYLPRVPRSAYWLLAAAAVSLLVWSFPWAGEVTPLSHASALLAPESAEPTLVEVDPGWNGTGWTELRGGTVRLTPEQRSFRSGVLLCDVSASFAQRDTTLARGMLRALLGLHEEVRGLEGIAVELRNAVESPTPDPLYLERVLKLGNDPAWLDAGIGIECARLLLYDDSPNSLMRARELLQSLHVPRPASARIDVALNAFSSRADGRLELRRLIDDLGG